MRTSLLLPVLALVTAACGSPVGQDNHGYGYTYDAIGASGLRVRYDGHPVPTLAQIEALYRETETCTGINATGPLVIFVRATFGAHAMYGQTFLDTGTILISSLLDPDPHLSFWTYKHEFVHHLLHHAGLDPARNAAHDSPLFTTCTGAPTTL